MAELTYLEMENNKNKFKEILNKLIRIPEEEKAAFLKMLDMSDFFDAPATANSFRNYAGGLCEHALQRYTYLAELASDKGLEHLIDPDSIIIVGLLADLGKINYFEPSVRNKKVYRPDGSKHDELGNFDWVAEKSFQVRDAKDRYVFGSLGQNAERLVSGYIPLSDQESAAIIHLHADYENPNMSLASIYCTYPLAVLLNMADRWTAFISTREDVQPF